MQPTSGEGNNPYRRDNDQHFAHIRGSPRRLWEMVQTDSRSSRARRCLRRRHVPIPAPEARVHMPSFAEYARAPYPGMSFRKFLFELVNFLLGQQPPFPASELLVFEKPDAYPFKLFDRMANSLKHAPDCWLRP